MSTRTQSPRLVEAAPDLARILKRGGIVVPARYEMPEITLRTIMVPMRDGVRLATDIYLPPELPAPTVAIRTPYGRGVDHHASAFMALARRGFAIVSQDVRGTGGSEPHDGWDHYLFEPEDGWDCVEWIVAQDWFDGFLGAAGGSYVGQTQWHMAMHPAMTTIVPEVSGLGIAINTVHWHMFINAYSRSVGHGIDKVGVPYDELEGLLHEETLATGVFDEPLHNPMPDAVLEQLPALRELSPTDAKRRLWEHYCGLGCAQRADLIKRISGHPNVTMGDLEAMSGYFGQHISHDRHTLPHTDMAELVRDLHAPVLFRTGFYDWGVNDVFATWDLIQREGSEAFRSKCRMFLAPSAHNMPGYHEGFEDHPELHHAYLLATNVELLRRWYEAVRHDEVDDWPTVIYYLMGANEWRVADGWPVPGAETVNLYLGADGALGADEPTETSAADHYTYDPEDPTPTVGGSIVSYVYPPGSVDVSAVQARPDVLTYTTGPLEEDLDVVGPVRLVLYASSSAIDTDFAARLTDVFPDGRAVQLQNGVLRARYRNVEEPAFLEPGKVYRLDIDMWAAANRFRKGHRLRLDISSADFPRYDRQPHPAEQTIYRDRDRPSHLVVQVLRGIVS
jgi:uncharacterized protein